MNNVTTLTLPPGTGLLPSGISAYNIAETEPPTQLAVHPHAVFQRGKSGTPPSEPAQLTDLYAAHTLSTAIIHNLPPLFDPLVVRYEATKGRISKLLSRYDYKTTQDIQAPDAVTAGWQDLVTILPE